MPTLTRAEQERLHQAIVFFASRVQALGKIKLFKLLYLFDFEHFKQTGKSVTGLDYQAWKLGPVPVELMDEWEELGPDLARLVHIQIEQVIDYRRQAVKVNEDVTFDPDPFSPRQMRILQSLADQYRHDLSAPMVDVTQAQNGAWARTWRGGDGRYERIRYELAISDDQVHAEELRELAREQAMYRAALIAARHTEPD